jgi:hypothetical protein
MERLFSHGDTEGLCTATETILKTMATTDFRWPAGLNESGYKAAVAGAILPVLPRGWSLRSEVKAGNGFIDLVVSPPPEVSADSCPRTSQAPSSTAAPSVPAQARTTGEKAPTVREIAIELKFVPPGWAGSTEKKTSAALSSREAIARQCAYLNGLKAPQLEDLFVTTGAKTLCKVASLCDAALEQSTRNASRLARSTNRPTTAIALIGVGQRTLARRADVP